MDVLVPWRSTPERDSVRGHVHAHLEGTLDSTVRYCDDPRPIFNRGRALNAGMNATRGWLVVWADADLLIPEAQLLAAVEAVEAGAPLVVPFTSVHYLTEAATREVLAGADPFDSPELDSIWDDLSSGGCNVTTRSTWEQAGGFDERFTGWGFEDAAFGLAVDTLVGEREWIDGPAVHLWHPHDPTRHSALYDANANLAARYDEASGNPDLMRELTGVPAA